jgi:hypothetical protein
MSTIDDVLKDLRVCERNQKEYTEAMIEFQSACLAKNWKAAEQAHAKAVGSIDAYFDNMAAAYKRRG